MRSSTPCFCFSVTVATEGEPDLLASRAARAFLAEAGCGMGSCLDPLRALPVGAGRIRARRQAFAKLTDPFFESYGFMLRREVDRRDILFLVTLPRMSSPLPLSMRQQ